MTVLRSIASWKTTAETTMMMTRLAVFSTEEVTAPTWLVNANANNRGEMRFHGRRIILYVDTS